MPKFKVTKCVDAFVHYEAIIEANDAKDARQKAENLDHELNWEQGDVSEYDDTDFDNIEPELIP